MPTRGFISHDAQSLIFLSGKLNIAQPSISSVGHGSLRRVASVQTTQRAFRLILARICRCLVPSANCSVVHPSPSLEAASLIWLTVCSFHHKIICHDIHFRLRQDALIAGTRHPHSRTTVSHPAPNLFGQFRPCLCTFYTVHAGAARLSLSSVNQQDRSHGRHGIGDPNLPIGNSHGERTNTTTRLALQSFIDSEHQPNYFRPRKYNWLCEWPL
ncbi:hypothetical protein DFH06DRAFT_1198528 [Mycena polygramma]|nr:hypothetical protein DFH06DRAFT_1198528 [Mycena polygramma]